MSQKNSQNSPAASNRLPSLRAPRDVTLSGASTSNGPGLGSTKPKFTPNLSAAGRRNAPTPTTSDGGNARGGRGRGGRGAGANKNRRSNAKYEPEIIQSKGIFSDGLAETSVGSSTTKNHDFGGGGGGGRTGGRGILRDDDLSPKEGRKKMMTTKVKSEAMETDEVALKQLFKDGFISDLREGDVRPVVLPFAGANLKIKDWTKVEETSEQEQSVAKSLFGAQDDQNLFVVVQLPSVLSDMLSAKDDEYLQPKQEIKTETEMEVDESHSAQKETGTDNSDKRRRPFETLPEGPLGKLQVLKSGRVRLKLFSKNDDKPIYFDVNNVPSTFGQKLVSVHCDDAEANEGSMNVIADKIYHKMLITPNMEEIINNLKR